MKIKYVLVCLVISLFVFPLISFASEWMVFTPKQKDGATWYYDKDSISYPRNKTFIGITLPFSSGNYPKMWVKASSDTGEIFYQAELSCRERTVRMMDNNGKGIYNLTNIDYIFDRAVPPDTVLDLLRRAVCNL
jgi:hypothetical protein